MKSSINLTQYQKYKSIMEILKFTQEIHLDPVPWNFYTNEDLSKHCSRSVSLECYLWSTCSKNEFCGKVKVDLAVWYSFNLFITWRFSLLNIVSNPPTKDILSTSCKEDTKHIKSATKNILDCAQQWWKQKAKRRPNHIIPTKLPDLVFLLNQKVPIYWWKESE